MGSHICMSSQHALIWVGRDWPCQCSTSAGTDKHIMSFWICYLYHRSAFNSRAKLPSLLIPCSKAFQHALCRASQEGKLNIMKPAKRADKCRCQHHLSTNSDPACASMRSITTTQDQEPSWRQRTHTQQTTHMPSACELQAPSSKLFPQTLDCHRQTVNASCA